MLSPGIETALNEQINEEQAASQEYLAMSAYFESQGLKGFATFMRKQSAEETEHALKLYHYIFDRGGSVRLGPIPEPRAGFESTKAVFQRALGLEQANTKGIHGLYKLASDGDDYATKTMLHWFINEQVEEEQWCEEALTLLEMVADNRSALLMLDKRYREKVD